MKEIEEGYYIIAVVTVRHEIRGWLGDDTNTCLTFRPHASYIYDRRTATHQSKIFIYCQQINLIILLDLLSPSSFIPPQNVVYFLMLPLLVHKIFTFYTNGVLNCKYPATGPKG